RSNERDPLHHGIQWRRRNSTKGALPEGRVTLHSGHIGNTSGLCGSAKCLGRSVTRWMSGYDLWRDCSRARRWRRCVESSMSLARPATRSSIATRIAGSKEEVSDKIWLVSFMHYDLGFFDHETARLESAENPVAAKVLPMSPV